MTDIGRGQLGLLSNLRPFSEFIDDSGSQKQVFVEARPGKLVSGWSLHSGNAYLAPFSYTTDGLSRDVVGVQTLLDSGLTRVESLSLCVSTAGSFYFDPDEQSSTARWDDNISRWDDGILKWDVFPKLYVHLTDNSNPNNTTVEAFLGFYWGSHGDTHPALGDEITTNGTFEASLTGLSGEPTTEWKSESANGTGGASSATRVSTTSGDGTYSCALALSGGVGSSGAIYAGVAAKHANGASGAPYRICGYYQTSAITDACAPFLIVSDDSVASYVTTDGRSSTSTATTVQLDPTYGAWRRFCFDFINPFGVFEVRVRNANTGHNPVGTVYVDGLSIRRIWRYNYYVPRLDASSVPASESGSNDIFFGGKRVGTGTLTVSNADGVLEALFGDLDWANKEAYVTAGGVFLDGQALTFDDYRRAFTGLVQGIDGNDQQIHIDLQDIRSFFHRKLPLRVYDDVTFPGLNTSNQGKARPYWFGVKENISPIRISKDASTLYGTYELADCAISPNGIKSIDTVYAYADQNAATARDSARRITLSSGTDYTSDLPNGQLTVAKDVQVIQITADNDIIDFNDGSVRTATIAHGYYLPRTLATAIVTAINATSSNGTCTYSDTTHKFTVGRTSGTFTMLISTGANKQRAPYRLLGFSGSADLSGSSSYTATDAVFTDPDTQHILRVNGQGYKDDASGTYTGSANALIEKGCDICYVILRKCLNKPASVRETTSFDFARQRAPETLALYLNETVNSKEVFDRLEYSNIANIVIDGEGKVHYEVYVGDVPSNITDFYDYDFLEFSAQRRTDDVYTSVKVLYDQNPTTGDFEGRLATDDSVGLRFGRPDRREFETYIKKGDNAQAAANRLSELAKRPARVIKFSAKGKLVDKKVGDKIRLTRSRAIDPNGKLSSNIVRIITIKQEHLDAKVYVECVDDVVTVAGAACLTACQTFCESTCQESCQTACQSTCETSCQIGCEVACQATCQSVCQTTCQLTCQTTCQISCQSACQTACQAGCQSGCQNACESSCQDGCQSSCQEGCQVSCQTSCQAGSCQFTCQLACQTGCEVSCQTACETSCQQSCELNCQTGCQISCESSCQLACQSFVESQL